MEANSQIFGTKPSTSHPCNGLFNEDAQEREVTILGFTLLRIYLEDLK